MEVNPLRPLEALVAQATLDFLEENAVFAHFGGVGMVQTVEIKEYASLRSTQEMLYVISVMMKLPTSRVMNISTTLLRRYAGLCAVRRNAPTLQPLLMGAPFFAFSSMQLVFLLTFHQAERKQYGDRSFHIRFQLFMISSCSRRSFSVHHQLYSVIFSPLHVFLCIRHR